MSLQYQLFELIQWVDDSSKFSENGVRVIDVHDSSFTENCGEMVNTEQDYRNKNVERRLYLDRALECLAHNAQTSVDGLEEAKRTIEIMNDEIKTMRETLEAVQIENASFKLIFETQSRKDQK